MLDHAGSIPLDETNGGRDEQMPVQRFLNFMDVPAGKHLLKVVLCKIEEAVRRASPQDSRTRKTQTPHGIGCALPQVIHR